MRKELFGLAGAILLLCFAWCDASGRPAEGNTSPEIPILLAQEEDIDESYNDYGQDLDEEIEYDNAILKPDTTDFSSLLEGITWLGHSSLLIEVDEKILYIDPFDLKTNLPKADLILITHDHFDHLSPEDILKLLKTETIVISMPAARKKLPSQVRKFIALSPGDSITIDDLKITTVPAYNLKKEYHPRAKGYLGFILTWNHKTIYHAGDTDFIPEMRQIHADVAFLPVDGKYTMKAYEAAKAADAIHPKVAIPIHWGKIVGTRQDAETFKVLSHVPVVILKPFEANRQVE